MNLKDFVERLEGNPLVDITVWRDDYPYTIARMRKDNVLKSPKFAQYKDIEVTDYAKDGRDYVIYLVI